MTGAEDKEGGSFLSIPPFPDARAKRFDRLDEPVQNIDDPEADRLLALLAELRVGGCYWGQQPALPQRYSLWCSDQRPTESHEATVIWAVEPAGGARHLDTILVPHDCDPWYLLSRASELACNSDCTEKRLIAGLAGVPVRLLDQPDPGPVRLGEAELRSLLRSVLAGGVFLDPFTGRRLALGEAMELCAFWRKLIDSNRAIAAAFGFAGWKRRTTAPLLWGGNDVAFDPPVKAIQEGQEVALWRSRVSPSRLAELDQRGAVAVEVEDGFIRSAGLGANCVPPQSILVDRLGVHFDARRTSNLERLLESMEIPAELLVRARDVRTKIKASGLSKYDSGQEQLERRSKRRHILVPGQVEDDRAVLEALGGVLANEALLARVREHEPHAYLIYKPHPDVEAGHRKGSVADADALAFADEVVRAGSISSWIDLVDEVHVNSSLAGFEALMRGKSVTTYGVPFYAGWGLTRDRGPVPHRRTRARSLDEAVAICLLVYPRYVDPHTNLPCPLEVLIDRLLDPVDAARSGPLVAARRAQGWVKRLARKLMRRRP